MHNRNKTIAEHITQKNIQNEAEKLATTLTNGTCGLFAVHTANSWIESVKNKPQPRMLFSEFQHEDELSILFNEIVFGLNHIHYQLYLV